MHRTELSIPTSLCATKGLVVTRLSSNLATAMNAQRAMYHVAAAGRGTIGFIYSWIHTRARRHSYVHVSRRTCCQDMNDNARVECAETYHIRQFHFTEEIVAVLVNGTTSSLTERVGRVTKALNASKAKSPALLPTPVASMAHGDSPSPLHRRRQ